MRAYARSGLPALTALTVAVSVASAQAPPARPPAATVKAAAPPVAPPKPAAILKQVLGTVNTEVVTRGDLINFLNRYQIPAGNEEMIYRDAMDSLINSRLVNQFLDRQRIPVSEAKIDEQLATLEKQLKQDGTDLSTELLRSNKSVPEVRKEIAERIRFIEFLNIKATDAELKKFVASHRDLFNGTQVRASHVLLKGEPKASAEDKEKLRQKVAAIKGDILANKMTFAQAANKFSEDPANTEGAGGDVGYFGLNSGFIEEFANAAFALKKGSISDVVETPYGYHLILVTDRKEGTPLDFEQSKPLVKQMYANDLQKTILVAERKAAKIDVKPLPTDLFPPAQAPTSPPAAAATKGVAPK